MPGQFLEFFFEIRVLCIFIVKILVFVQFVLEHLSECDYAQL